MAFVAVTFGLKLVKESSNIGRFHEELSKVQIVNEHAALQSNSFLAEESAGTP